uniref:HSF-type DNA-binding domain-containing protein n=1 Tax=Anopheles atroparvus TaxID=41427 RepID=A0A182JIL9_ANOAO
MAAKHLWSCLKLFAESEICFLLVEAPRIEFVLKLWLAINDDAVHCLRWNAEQTAIFVDLGALGTAYMEAMFDTETELDFLRLLKHNGFERGWPEANEPSGSTELVYRHSAFVMSNARRFREWFSVSRLRLEGSEEPWFWLQPHCLANEFRPQRLSDCLQPAKGEKTKAEGSEAATPQQCSSGTDPRTRLRLAVSVFLEDIVSSMLTDL